MDIGQFEQRKRDHIQQALDPVNQTTGQSGLAQIHLFHEALPELDFKEVSLSSVCLGKPAPTPFYVAGMTAGHPDAAGLNRSLALACQDRGWAMGVGSQRRDLEAGQSDESLDRWKALRQDVPRLTLFGNLGITQLIRTPINEVRRVVDAIDAQALCIHVNAHQEVIQPEGTPRFKGALAALEKICRELDRPVVLKETGCGFSPATLRRLMGIGLAAIDVSGLGGTHWGRIEGARSEKAHPGIAANTFRNWGESTADSVIAAKATFDDTMELWASGGVRDGLEAAKLIALGSHRVGFAKPALEAALKGPEAVAAWMDQLQFELRVALFCTGAPNPLALRSKPDSWKKT